VLVVVDTGRKRGVELAHVTFRDVVAVTTIGSGEADVSPASFDGDAPAGPSRLEVQRLAVKVFERLVPVQVRLELPKPIRDDDVAPLGALLPVLDAAVEGLLAHEGSRGSLQAIETLRLAVSATAEVRREGKVLLVVTSISPARRVDASALRQRIGEVL